MVTGAKHMECLQKGATYALVLGDKMLSCRAIAEVGGAFLRGPGLHSRKLGLQPIVREREKATPFASAWRGAAGSGVFLHLFC
jgi:hypothetical protein